MKTIPMDIAVSIEELGKFAEVLNKTLEAIEDASLPEDDEAMQEAIVQSVIDSLKPVLSHLCRQIHPIFPLPEFEGERGVILTSDYGNCKVAVAAHNYFWVLKKTGEVEKWEVDWESVRNSSPKLKVREHYKADEKIGRDKISPLLFFIRMTNPPRPQKAIEIIITILKEEIEKREKWLSGLKTRCEQLTQISQLLSQDPPELFMRTRKGGE